VNTRVSPVTGRDPHCITSGPRMTVCCALCFGRRRTSRARRRVATALSHARGTSETLNPLNPSKNRVSEKARFWKLSSGSRAKSGQFYSPCPHGFFNEPECKYKYGISLFHTSAPERRVVTPTVKISRPACPVPIYYGIYAIHPAQWRG